MTKKINSRSKGKRGERDAINKVLQPLVSKVYQRHGLVPPVVARNLQQWDAGGYDIIGLDWLACEVKFCEKFNLKKWWSQTLSQTKHGQVPLLLFRKSRGQFSAMTWGMMPTFVPSSRVEVMKLPVILNLSDFNYWFENEIDLRLKYEILRNNARNAVKKAHLIES